LSTAKAEFEVGQLMHYKYQPSLNLIEIWICYTKTAGLLDCVRLNAKEVGLIDVKKNGYRGYRIPVVEENDNTIQVIPMICPESDDCPDGS